MTDQRFTELLGRKLADEISMEEHKEFMLLLEGNAVYKQEYESLNRYFQQQETEQEDAAPLFQQIKARIESSESVGGSESMERPEPLESPVSKSRFGTWSRIAAALALCICSVAAYQFLHQKSELSGQPELVWKEQQTPSRLTSKLTLADGSVVTLNAETQLKYPAEFKGNSREVYLSGEAFFEVKKDAQHPFIIHTEKMSIKVLGTTFDVKAYKNDPNTEATLITGAIQINLKDQSRAQITMKPQEKFSLQNKATNGKDSVMYSVLPFNDTETAWMNHKLAFKNEAFETLANSISRWYGLKLVFKNESLKNTRFTGFFEKENISQALKALQLIEPFQYKIQGKTVYIY